jgi:hypothetical protein
MKKLYYIAVLLFVTSSIYAQTRKYQPVSQWENQFYQIINKNVWPDDVRENIELYKNTLVGWVGIIKKFITDENNDEYNIIGFYIKHHFFDWIEDFGMGNKPIRLSPDGEGYFVCYYYVKKDFDINELTKDVIGDCIINYGNPTEIDDGVIILSTEYLRIIPKIYVDPDWIKYGRNGFGEILKNE